MRTGPAQTEQDGPRPTVPAEGEVPYLNAELATEVGSIRIRLVGVAAGRGAPAYAWLGDGEKAPAATLPLVLGHQGPWRLHVDLSRAPDVLTLVGPREASRRTAALFVRQLRRAGIGVAVVGDVLKGENLDGVRNLDDLPAPPAPGDDLPEPYVVITGALAAGAMADARKLAGATGGRCVPMVIGPVPGGRWSIQLDPEGPGRTGD